jgi:hypothetical protein
MAYVLHWCRNDEEKIAAKLSHGTPLVVSGSDNCQARRWCETWQCAQPNGMLAGLSGIWLPHNRRRRNTPRVRDLGHQPVMRPGLWPPFEPDITIRAEGCSFQ